MNGLSWLLYFADVLPSISAFVGTGAGILGFTGLVAWIGGGAFANASDEDSDDYRLAHWWEIMGRKFFLVCVAVVPLTLLIPDTQTFYLIAASEAGEVVVESDEAQMLFDRVTAIIDQELDSFITGE